MTAVPQPDWIEAANKAFNRNYHDDRNRSSSRSSDLVLCGPRMGVSEVGVLRSETTTANGAASFTSTQAAEQGA